MISGSRSMLQASVDDRREVIERLIATVPNQIKNHFNGLEDSARRLAEENSAGDNEEYSSILSGEYESYHPEDEERMIMDFYRSMVLLICSYAETTIKSLLAKPDQTFKSNYLCCAFKQIKYESDLDLKGIGYYWQGHQQFVRKRNDIAHRHQDVCVNENELMVALSGAHSLLRAIADAIEVKRKEKQFV